MSQDDFQALQDAVVRALDAFAELRRTVGALKADREAFEEEIGLLRARLQEREHRLEGMEILESERRAIRARLERVLESLAEVGLGESG
jgi:septal ring factor EnvC (AmiA/AmiB activator)